MQSFILYITLGILLSAVGFSIISWQFWCFFGLFWGACRIARHDGQVEAIIAILHTMKKLKMDSDQLLKELKK